MNQIKQKIEEIGLSQREISVRLGKNPSYLAGVFRTGLSTAKQAELLELLDIVSNGGAVQSDDEIIADLSWKLTDCQDGNKQLRDRLNESQFYLREANSTFAELTQRLADAQDAGIKALEGYGIVQKQLTETQKYLLEANQECEQIESKYKSVLIFNYVLSLVILGVAISWVLA